MEGLKQNVMKSRKIKASSWKTYERYINELAQKVTEEHYKENSFLKDKAGVQEIIETYGGSKRRVCLSVILVILSPDKKMAPIGGVFPEEATELYKHYHELHKQLTADYNKEKEEQKKSTKQSENWVDWLDIIRLQRNFMNKIRREKYNKKENLSKPQLKVLQNYLIVSLYTLIKPRRLDYAEMKILSHEDYKALDIEDKKAGNFLVIKSKIKKFFAFGAGAQKNENGGDSDVFELNVPKKLNRVLQLYLKHHKEDYLLFNARRSGEISKDGLSKQLQKIMGEAFDGKRFSASMLRTIYLTHLHKDTPSIKEQQQTALEMGHSPAVATLHYTKKI